MPTQQRKRSRRVCHYLLVALGAWLLVGCPAPPTPPSPSGNVPPCGPRILRQQLLFASVGASLEWAYGAGQGGPEMAKSVHSGEPWTPG